MSKMMKRVESHKNLLGAIHGVHSFIFTLHLHHLPNTKHQLMACDQWGSSELIKCSDILRKTRHSSLSANPWVWERVRARILAFPHMSPHPLSTSSKAACLISNMFGINSFAIVLVSLSLLGEGNWQVLSQLLTNLKQHQDGILTQPPTSEPKLPQL